ncbi:hypothetical protein BpHYR1_014534 [Brachionus plicatilis]|uniref:Uncharacterized protein n=1 Tax=Brachionus plicatilis TaxID=10195 RepID=A0A3M7PYC6_BRAPC|nr:hypothetical protein BpHYR1_014534 [Brachionus plicatilis]
MVNQDLNICVKRTPDMWQNVIYCTFLYFFIFTFLREEKKSQIKKSKKIFIQENVTISRPYALSDIKEDEKNDF